MGSYASTIINNYELFYMKNYFDQWFFHKNDRVRIIKNGEIKFIGYRVDLHTLKRRLNLAGFDKNFAINDFNETRNQWIDYLKTVPSNFEDDKILKLSKEQLNLLMDIDFDKWLRLLPDFLNSSSNQLDTDIKNNELASSLSNIIINFDISVMASASCYFPCKHLESLAIVLIELENTKGFCEVDLTDLYQGGWIEDFEDLAQQENNKTYFFENFEISINDLRKLQTLEAKNPVLNKMLLSSSISAMEAYLFDTFKKQVLERETIKRKYVKSYKSFHRGGKLDASELFDFLDALDEKISREIDEISFHNINLVKGLYHNILHCQFNESCLSKLNEIIKNRHDIVHRNGKTVSNEIISISNDDLNNRSLS